MDMLMRRYWRDEIVLAFLLVALFATVVGMAFGFRRDAGLFPLIIGSAGILLSVLLVVAGVRGRLSGDASQDSVPSDSLKIPDRLWTAILAPLLFGVFLWGIGFYVASFLTALLLPPLMGYRNRRGLIIFAVLTTLGTIILFPVLLEVDLPHGLIGDWVIEKIYAES